MRIALCQINPTVGDIAGNAAKHLEFVARARAAGAALAVFPELSLLGYPPKDLLLKPSFVEENLRAVEAMAADVSGIDVIVGYADRNPNPVGRPLYNAVALLRDGRVASRHFKTLLPTYDVFDESRYFEPGERDERENLVPVSVGGPAAAGGGGGGPAAAADRRHEHLRGPLERRAVDRPPAVPRQPDRGPDERRGRGAGERQRQPVRDRQARVPAGAVRRPGAAVRQADRVREPGRRERRAGVRREQRGDRRRRPGAGQRQGVRGGPAGRRRRRAPAGRGVPRRRGGLPLSHRERVGARESVELPTSAQSGPADFGQTDVRPHPNPLPGGEGTGGGAARALATKSHAYAGERLGLRSDRPAGSPERYDEDELESVFKALVLGLRDYVYKTGFKSVVLGLSGGIDSALTAALAVEAFGPEQVVGVAMPSRYSSGHSVDDARELAANLGVTFHVIPIQGRTRRSSRRCPGVFAGRAPDVAEENLQARSRGVILMALSNKFNHLLLTTGNKSELAVGYCTLYGDMAGGLAVISDVPKTLVWELSGTTTGSRAGT
jgi:hypothetical protein